MDRSSSEQNYSLVSCIVALRSSDSANNNESYGTRLCEAISKFQLRQNTLIYIINNSLHIENIQIGMPHISEFT